MVFVNLAEVAQLRTALKLFGSRRYHPLAFLEEDHRFGTVSSLEEEIRSSVAEKTGELPDGPIGVLTVLRTWGYYFSPLSLYYCFDRSGDAVRAIVAEVSNTPWLERHRYVLFPIGEDGKDEFEFEHKKDFHVSPFMPMDQEYCWRCSSPDDHMHIQITTKQAGKPIFAANMNLKRKPLTDATLLWSLFRYPWMTGRIVSAIYWQAFCLWWKRCPFYTHPKKITLSNVDSSPLEEKPLAITRSRRPTS